MEKWSGLRVGEYEVVDPNLPEDPDYEYEEIEVEELLNRNNMTDEEKTSFIKSYWSVNIHQLLSEETYQSCLELLEDIKNDKRLEKLNAVVFLMLKPKGNRNKYHNIQFLDRFYELIHKYQEAGVQIGMDSCTAPLMFKFAHTHDQMSMVDSIEPCESTLFSVYINVKAEMYPCSFTEDTPGWETGINLLEATDFLKDVWYNPKTKEWRESLLASSKSCDCPMKAHCRSCPVYPQITPCKT